MKRPLHAHVSAHPVLVKAVEAANAQNMKIEEWNERSGVNLPHALYPTKKGHEPRGSGNGNPREHGREGQGECKQQTLYA